MDYLPPAVNTFLQGHIDYPSQRLLETHSQTYLAILSAISFIASYATGSVLIALELFLGGLVVLLLIAVPPWPMFLRQKVKYLPQRTAKPEE